MKPHQLKKFLAAYLLVAIGILFHFASSAQEPFSLQWQKFYGGSNTERNDYIGKTIAPAFDGGYLSTSYTLSDDLLSIGYHGGGDILAIKLDNSGEVVWKKCYGGSDDDQLHSVINTNDGGFLIMGYTASTDGDVQSFNHGNYDGWLMKIDGVGNVEWEKCFGGSDFEFLPSGLQNDDGSFMITLNSFQMTETFQEITGALTFA